MSIMELIAEHVSKTPDQIIFYSSKCLNGISYRQFGDYTGRIYNYLKQHGIGREDIVMICLQRGVRIPVAMYGVLRAGAAFTVVESTYAPERIAYIKNDTHTKLVIDEGVYSDMMKYESIGGYEKTDPHDACFAVYTSGSTGNPKGVLHEYGKLEEILHGSVSYDGESRFACISPLNFTASLGYLIDTPVVGRTTFIVPYEIVKNPVLYVKFLEENRITEAFAMPSMMKILPSIPETLKCVVVGGEVISNFYVPGPTIYNSYSSAEVVYRATSFIIDKAYENTPVGKNVTSHKPFVVDENGNRLPQGEKGEVCIEDAYTRGYINLPEKTAAAFIDGVFHFGDIGFFNENDDLVICGRKDDMIKINGNRIEPAKIEGAVKKVLKINNCMAKGFIDESRSFIAAYLLRPELEKSGLLDETDALRIDTAQLRDQLATILPYYMIPTYFEILDDFPKNANGKLARKDLPKPIISAEESTYIAPEGEEQEYFCNLFAKVLGLEKVSADGDFYSLGGDSMHAMRLIADCRYSEICITDLYQSRTPAKLAERLKEEKSIQHKGNDEGNRKALEHLQPLTSEVRCVIDTQLASPKATLWNLTIFTELKDNVDIDCLKVAIDRVLSAHPLFCTHFVLDDSGNMLMEYKPEYYQETEIVRLSEKEFQENKDTFSSYYVLIGKPLYRNRIYITEKSAYLFLDFYHAITDGTSLRIIREQISKAYRDASYVPETDYYYLIARNVAIAAETEEYRETGRAYRMEAEMVLEKNRSKPVSFLKPDLDGKGCLGRRIERTLDISKKALKEDSLYFKYGGNTLFMYAFLKAQAQYNENDCAYLSWTHNGRDTAIAMKANGLLFHTYPMYIDFSKIASDEDGIKCIKERIASEIAVEYRDYFSDNMDILWDGSDFLYQNDILVDTWKNDLTEKEVPLGSDKESDAAVQLMLLDNAESDSFSLNLLYWADRYSEEAMDRFLDMFSKNVNSLLA